VLIYTIGCTVSLIAASKVDEFIGTVKKEYFDKLDGIQFEDVVFFCKPNAGGAIIKLE
jgi:hypothetical protein